jgi:site-specific recombinase XerD
MSQLILPGNSSSIALPQLITDAGDQAANRFLEFFAANIRNPGTRATYANAIRQFCQWCSEQGVELKSVKPLVVATYIEQLTGKLSDPTVKLHLAAIRSLFDYLVVGQIVPFNPASSVRGPKHVVKKGKTPVLTAAEARQLLDSIDISTVIGLRDRALLAVMVFSFARVSATIGMNLDDYYVQGRRMWFRLHEKGGKHHEVPTHHKAEEYLDAYLAVASLDVPSKAPLFRTIGREGKLTSQRMHRTDALRMVKRRAAAAGLSTRVCNHSFRATGITTFLENGGLLEQAQRIAAHESARSTKLYDRTSDTVTLDEIERIII